MMKKLLLPLAVVASFSVTDAIASACTSPADVQLPDGASATTEQMISGQKAVKAYIADGNAFLNCLEADEKALGAEIAPEMKAAISARYNEVVDKMQLLGENFNQQIKAYKAAQAK